MEQLLAMGFPSHKCKKALTAAGNVDGAISFILENDNKPDSFWQLATDSQPTTQLTQPTQPTPTTASADSILAKLQEALTSSREESTSFGRKVLNWLRVPPSDPPSKLRGDLEEAPALSERRKQMYTASRFADMAGISPYGLPHSLWLVMTGREPADEIFQGNEATRRGQELEPVARRAYELRFAKCAPPSDFEAHPEHIWLGATPDGLIGEDGLLEIKCPMHKTHEEVPPHYMAQVQGQLEITGRTWCDFVSWRPDRMVVIHVPRSREYWAWLYPLLERFYAHVLSDQPLPSEAAAPPSPPPVANVVTLYDGPPPLVTAKLPVRPTPVASVTQAESSAEVPAAAAAAAPSASEPATAASASAARSTTGSGNGSCQSTGVKRTADQVGEISSPPTKKVAATTDARVYTRLDTTVAPAKAVKSSPSATTTLAKGTGAGLASKSALESHKTSQTSNPAAHSNAGTPGASSGNANVSKAAVHGSRDGKAGGVSGVEGKSGSAAEKKKHGKDGSGRGGKGGSGGRGRGRNRGGRGGKGKGRGKGAGGGAAAKS